MCHKNNCSNWHVLYFSVLGETIKTESDFRRELSSTRTAHENEDSCPSDLPCCDLYCYQEMWRQHGTCCMPQHLWATMWIHPESVHRAMPREYMWLQGRIRAQHSGRVRRGFPVHQRNHQVSRKRTVLRMWNRLWTDLWEAEANGMHQTMSCQCLSVLQGIRSSRIRVYCWEGLSKVKLIMCGFELW